MNKALLYILVVIMSIITFSFSALAETSPEIVPVDTEVYFGDTKLDIPVYSDGTEYFVSVDKIMTMVGGSCAVEDGKITVSINTDATPAAQTSSSSNIIFEDDHISVVFNGFSFYAKNADTGATFVNPQIVITNKTNEDVSFKIIWDNFYVNGCKIKPSNTWENIVNPNGKLAFTAAGLCVINLGDLADYGETAFNNIEMNVDLSYGNTTKNETWTIDCDIPFDSIQP